MNQSKLKTERLTLIGITPAKVHELASTKTKEDLLAYFGFGESGYQQFINMHEKGMETFSISFYSFLIVNTTTSSPIGDIGFHTWNSKHRRAELFYNINKDENKGKGYMSEALPRVIQFGFEELNLHRIAAMVADYNTPSVKLIQKNGFTFEGTLRKDYVVNGVNENSDCYSLLKTEWIKQNSINLKA